MAEIVSARFASRDSRGSCRYTAISPRTLLAKKAPEAQVSGAGEWCAYDNSYCCVMLPSVSGFTPMMEAFLASRR